MKIAITGRNIKVSDRQKDHVEKKIGKLDNYFNQLIDAHVILYVEKLDHAAEVIVNGDGVQFHGREKAADLFSAIDLLIDKMEKQVVRYKEKHQQHKGARPEDFRLEMEVPGSDLLPMVQVSNKPLDRIEAYLQMKLDNSDFILFKMGVSEIDSGVDYSNKNYAAIYNKGGSTYLVEIPYDSIREHKYECETFTEYELVVKNDSPSSPDIEFRQVADCSIEKQTVEEALGEAQKSSQDFHVFFNTETQYFNVIYRNGKKFEVQVPAY